MSKVYERADEAVAKVIDEAKRTIHHVLRLCEVTCDALFVAEYATDDDEQETALAMLERRFKDDWGLTQKHEHAGKDGGAIEFYRFKLPEEET